MANPIIERSLKIGDELRIFFDENEKPGYYSASGADLALVRDQLYSCAGFITTWLEEAEEIKVKPLNVSQIKLRKMLTPLARALRRDLKQSKEKISRSLNIMVGEMREEFPDLTLPEMEAVVRVLADGEK